MMVNFWWNGNGSLGHVWKIWVVEPTNENISPFDMRDRNHFKRFMTTYVNVVFSYDIIYVSFYPLHFEAVGGQDVK